MRRSTLGPVSASSLNARGSMTGGPGRAERGTSLVPSKAQIPPRRSSMASNPRLSIGSNARMSSAGMRRSSAFGGNARSKEDPRPLSDKAHMRLSVENLIKYLTENGFDQAISPKLLSSPTSKEYQQIFTFLVREIDPLFSFDKRFEEELPKVMKALRYPVKLSKSALHAVGSPHTWPALLGVLSWILELLAYDAEAQQKRGDAQALDLEADSTKSNLFFEYTAEAYEAFMAGEDDFGSLDSSLERRFAEKNRVIEDEAAALEKQVLELEAERASLESEEDLVSSLTNRRDGLRENMTKLEEFIRSLRQHEELLASKNSDREREAHHLEAELNSLRNSNEALRTTIAIQESSAMDSERIAKDRSVARGNLAMLSERVDAARTKQHEEEARVMDATRVILERIDEYHARMEQIELASAANASPYRIELSRDPSVSDPRQLVSMDLSRDVTPRIESVKSQYLNDLRGESERSLVMEKEVDNLEEAVSAKNESLKRLKRDFQKAEKDLQRRKALTEEQFSLWAVEARSLEEDIAAVKQSHDSLLRESTKSRESALESYQKLREQYENDIIMWYDSMSFAIDVAVQAKRHIQDLVAVLDSDVKLQDALGT